MATRSPGVTDRTESCTRCGHETPHTVTVEIKTESTKRENAQYSREPYRVSECLSCGETESVRMNNA